MKNKTMKMIKMGAVSISLAGLVTALGFGCGVGFQSGLDNSNTGLPSINGSDEILDNGNLVVVSGTRTVSTVYYEQVLRNMLSLAGLPAASDDTIERFDEKVGSFSEYGAADAINAPMMLGLAAVGSEVCADLMSTEFNVAQADRRLFNSVDFGAQAVDDAGVADMIRRMARTFWGRNETPGEVTMITDAVREIASEAENDNNNNQNFRGSQYRRGSLRAALATCTAMISSTSAIDQ